MLLTPKHYTPSIRSTEYCMCFCVHTFYVYVCMQMYVCMYVCMHRVYVLNCPNTWSMVLQTSTYDSR